MREINNKKKKKKFPISRGDNAVKTRVREITAGGGSTFPRNKLFFSSEIGGAKRHKYWQTTTINMTEPDY